jgi:hypothetical protein
MFSCYNPAAKAEIWLRTSYTCLHRAHARLRGSCERLVTALFTCCAALAQGCATHDHAVWGTGATLSVPGDGLRDSRAHPARPPTIGCVAEADTLRNIRPFAAGCARRGRRLATIPRASPTHVLCDPRAPPERHARTCRAIRDQPSFASRAFAARLPATPCTSAGHAVRDSRATQCAIGRSLDSPRAHAARPTSTGCTSLAQRSAPLGHPLCPPRADPARASYSTARASHTTAHGGG